MIRNALIALGLGAGAVSALLFGAGTARAQGIIRTVPVVAMCDTQQPDQAILCAAEIAIERSEQGEAPHDSVSVAQTTSSDVSPTNNRAAKGDATVRLVVDLYMDRDGGAAGVAAAFDQDALFETTLNGSDPSAGFWP